MGVGHVPEDPVHPEGEGAHLQGRERRGAAVGRALTPAQARGRFGEDAAARWYLQHGYEILDRNWRCTHGEVDLVVGAPGLVVFCEVKARASAAFGGPEAAVGVAKRRRVRRIAAAWLAARRPGSVEVRFDVVAIVGVRVTVHEAAF